MSRSPLEPTIKYDAPCISCTIRNAVLELGAADQGAAESELVGVIEVAADR